MFEYYDKKQIAIFAAFLLLIFSIPIGAVLVKQTQIFKSSAFGGNDQYTTQDQSTIKKEVTEPVTKSHEVPSASPLSEVNKLLQASPSPMPNELTPTPVVNLAFGPTLNVGIAIEGRPVGKQAAKVFIGIGSGTVTTKPTYILTFTVDFPEAGTFQGLSLAGLNPGSTYTAYIKGPSQIDTASTFAMSPTETNLNSGQALVLPSGDLNEDNTVNSADYTIAKNLYQTTPASSSWNSRADFNRDEVINNLDLGYIIKNFGKTGASGTWYSSPPPATSSALPNSLGSPATSAATSSATSSGGYWLWVP